MTHWLHYLALLALATGSAFDVSAAESSALEPGTAPAGFTSASAQAHGTSLHYVRGGQGPVIILLHGFPETWVEYQSIMPRLAQRFTTVAIDLPGVGSRRRRRTATTRSIWPPTCTRSLRSCSYSSPTSSATIWAAS
ncbi:MAG TPA: alpha/beta fold hydrolase [Steroidobacteraceae bacterium]|jgi:hypothetical protein